MAIPESVVAEVVAEVSERMSDPKYAQIAIGGFAQSHPDAGRYITAHLDELGGGEGVMHAVFHAELMNECFQRHLGRALAPIRFSQLDNAAMGDEVARFTKNEPALAAYLENNVDHAGMRKVLSLVGLAMSAASKVP
jgi:hypothetical protein